MRKALLFFILAITVKVYADDLVVSEYIPTADDPYYGITVKRIMYMDAENQPVKFIDYFSDSYALKTGVELQISYFKNEIPYLYEMHFTSAAQSQTGIKIKRDYVNDNDVIITNEVILVNETSWTINVATFDRYDFTVLENYISSEPDYYEKDLNNFEGPLFAGMSYIKISDDMLPIETEYKDFIKTWLQIHKFKDISFAYKGMLKYTFNNIECILAFQNTLFDIVNFEQALIQFYYLGSCYGKPVLMIMGYTEPSD